MDPNPDAPFIEQIQDILMAAQQGHMPGLSLVPFAALLIRVSNDANATINDLKAHITRLNDENSKLQRYVFWLTVASVVGTVVQTIAAFRTP